MNYHDKKILGGAVLFIFNLLHLQHFKIGSFFILIQVRKIQMFIHLKVFIEGLLCARHHCSGLFEYYQ